MDTYDLSGIKKKSFQSKGDRQTVSGCGTVAVCEHILSANYRPHAITGYLQSDAALAGQMLKCQGRAEIGGLVIPLPNPVEAIRGAQQLAG